METDYTVILYTPQELNHSSYIQTGLFELERLNIIRLKVKISTSKNLGRYIVSDTGKVTTSTQPHPKTSFYKLINNKDKSELFFATDLYDFANHFSKVALEKCDYIFKRSYEEKYVSQLPEKIQNKVHKLGQTFGVHSKHKHSDTLFLLGLIASNMRVSFKMDGFLFKRLAKSYSLQKKHWNFINTTRKLTRFENYTNAQKNVIIFQTRCFLREEEEDVISIHKQRYRIIKLLRKNFPNNFIGGFIPSKVSNEKYADALSNVPSEPEKYLDALKKAKIVIYTRGLANSPAWKMAEYLSQGKVIIAEPLSTCLPIPLIHGKEVLFFNNDEELISSINKVMEDENLANLLSKNARTYFEEHVHPTKNVKRILEFMISETLD